MAIIKKTQMSVVADNEPTLPILDKEASNPTSDIKKVLSNPVETDIVSPIVDAELGVMKVLKDSQLSMDTPASKHLSGSKTRVIYFNQFHEGGTTADTNLAAPSQVNNTKYNRIDNMIIITEAELSMSMNFESGIDTEVTSSGFIYPGSVTPYPSDLFYIHGKGGNVLYRITNVEAMYDIEDTAFKIEFIKHYDQFDPDQMANLVAGYYVFNFENVGTGKNTVLEKKRYDIYKTIIDTMKIVSSEFIRRFFDKHKNIFRYVYYKPDTDNKGYITTSEISSKGYIPDNDILEDNTNIFDVHLMEFFSKAFKDDNLEHNGYSICPMIPVWIDNDFQKLYRHTIFYAMQRRDPNLIKYFGYMPVKFNSRSLRELSYSNWYYFEPVGDIDERCVKIYPSSLLKKIVMNTKYTLPHDNQEYLKYNMIIEFFNNKSYVPSCEEIDIFGKTVEYMEDSELYGIGPLVLYIMSYFKNLVLKKDY